MSRVSEFSLKGLTCQHCVQRVKHCLEQRDDVYEAEVSLNLARVTGNAEADALIETIRQAGYQASLCYPEPGAELASPVSPLQSASKGISILPDQQAGSGVMATGRRAAKTGAAGAIASTSRLTIKAVSPEKTVPLKATSGLLTPTADRSPLPTIPSASPLQTSAADHLPGQQLLIGGMHCASCVTRVQQALEQVAGVQSAQVNLAQRSAWVTGEVTARSLIAALHAAGYPAEAPENEQQWRQRQQQSQQAETRRFSWQAALALLVGVPLMVWGMAGDHMMLTEANRLPWLVAGGVTLLVMLLAGGQYYRNAWRSLCNRTATMDSLVALGTAAAWGYSAAVNLFPHLFPAAARHVYYEACLMIIGLINLGYLLESRGRRRSSQALAQLIDLAPATACQMEEQGERCIALAAVQPGMLLRLRAGDRVPVDGELTEGEMWVDEAMLTGEAGLQHKTPGSPLYAGTLVQDGVGCFRAQRTGSGTTLARIIQLVRQAQSSKPAIGRLADRVAAVFVPLVLLIALCAGVIWYLVGPPPQIAYALVVATTVLIIACPCALGLATPMSTIAGVARAAELGVLVRDADALQQASQLDTLVLDKTGTLTEGHPKVTAIHTVDDFSEQQAIRLAAAVEQASTHPLARAICQYAEATASPDAVALHCAENVRTQPGLGLSGNVAGASLLVGSADWLHRHHVDTSKLAEILNAQAGQGATPVLLAENGQLRALFSIRDPLRGDTVTALQGLRQAGYRLIMLTGDNLLTANAVAREAGIDEVIAGVLPDGKANAIVQLQQQGRQVAMIGDGINDAPALAQAQVSMAMGSGSDIALETASIVLMRHSVQAAADALALSRATLRNMRQNLLGAFIYNIIAIPVAAGLLWPLTGTLLNPIIAGAAMALSSITVVGNANRLLRFKVDTANKLPPQA